MADQAKSTSSSAPDRRTEGTQVGSQDAAGIILMIGDLAGLAGAVRTRLERHGLRVYHAASGEAALDLFPQVQPALMLLDVALPDMSGWDALTAIQEGRHDGHSSLTLVVTDYGDPANQMMGRLQEVYAYLTKSPTAQQVELAVLAALKSRES